MTEQRSAKGASEFGDEVDEGGGGAAVAGGVSGAAAARAAAAAAAAPGSPGETPETARGAADDGAAAAAGAPSGADATGPGAGGLVPPHDWRSEIQQQVRREVEEVLGDVSKLVQEQVRGVHDTLLEVVRAEIQRAVRTAVTAAVTQAMQEMIPQTLEALRGQGANAPADGGPQLQLQGGTSGGAAEVKPGITDEEQLECRSCKSDMSSQQIQCTNSGCRRDQPGVPRKKPAGRDRDVG